MLEFSKQATANIGIESARDHSSARLARALHFVREHGIAEVFNQIRRHGLKESADFVLRNIRHSIAGRASRHFDKTFGVDTAGSLQLQYLTIDSLNAGDGTEAVSTSARSFDWMLKALPRPLSDYTFVDLGCGKGRTLLLAGKYGFHKAVGVEFALELASIADNNLRNSAVNFPGGAAIVHQDASSFAFPEGPMVVYLYNPFGAKVFETVLSNLVEHLRKSSAGCFIVYGSSKLDTFSWFRPMVEGSGFFEEMLTQPMPLFWDAVRTIKFTVYRRREMNN